MIVTIEVTQADIDAGGNCGGDCPVWRACSRVLPGVPWLFVGSVAAYENKNCGVALARLPGEAVAWILAYDAGRRVGPFTFELDVPESALTAGGAG